MPLFRIAGKTVLFIHVPKTGGTSVENALSKLAPMSMHSRGRKENRLRMGGERQGRGIPLQHLHAAPLAALLDPALVDYAFLIVRNPVDRLISEYRHSRELGRPETLFGFSAWLRFSLAVARQVPGFRNNHFRPQSDFACFGAKIFRFEDGLAASVKQVAADLGVEVPPLSHDRPSQKFEVAVRDGDRSLIRQWYKTDFEMFGYSPEASPAESQGGAVA